MSAVCAGLLRLHQRWGLADDHIVQGSYRHAREDDCGLARVERIDKGGSRATRMAELGLGTAGRT